MAQLTGGPGQPVATRGPRIHDSLTVADIIAERVRSSPTRPALMTDEEQWTYAELGARVTSCTRLLRVWGLERGDRLATIFPHTPDAVPWVLAAACHGVVSVPVNTRLSPTEVSAVLADADVRAVLVHPSLADWAHDLETSLADPWLILAHETVSAEAGPPLDHGLLEPDDPLTILYTSGSTGKPKGCVLTHRSMVTIGFNLFFAMGLTPSDRYLTTMPLFHVGGLAFVLGSVHAGGAVVYSGSADAADMSASIRKHGVTCATVPFVGALLDHVAATGDTLPTLRLVVWGSQMERPETIRRIESVLGAQWRGMFGSTESGNVALITDAQDELLHPGTIGRPVPGLAVAVIDPDSGQPVADGVVGELCVRGPSTMREYWRNPAATAAALAGGWVHTGDLVRRGSEGLLFFEGRAKDMIKSGGENVFAVEVEVALRAVQGVVDAAVFGVPDAKWGEAVAAVVVWDEAVPRPGVVDLQDQLRPRIAGYKIPKRLAVVDGLPKFQGKVQKAELRTAWTEHRLDFL